MFDIVYWQHTTPNIEFDPKTVRGRVVHQLWFLYEKRCPVRLYLQLFVGGRILYLCYLCLFAHSGVQHILCCDFVVFVFFLCTQCCQFLWIVPGFFIVPSVFSNVYFYNTSFQFEKSPAPLKKINKKIKEITKLPFLLRL